MKVEAQGFAELDRLLQQLPEQVARDHLSEAVEAGAYVIRDEAARRAPRDQGDLAESMTVKMGRTRNTGGDPEARIGPSKKEQHVGMFQEFGTAHNAAHPFLRPAADSRAQDAVNQIATTLRGSLERIGAR